MEDINFDDLIPSKDGQQKPQAAPVADVSFDDLIPSKTESNSQLPAVPHNAPAPVAPEQGQDAPAAPAKVDNSVNAHLSGMFASGASYDDIYKEADKAGVVGPNFASDLHHAINWRTGNKGDTKGFRGFVAPSAPAVERPKARPDGMSTGEAFVTGIAKAIPGSERIDAGLDTVAAKIAGTDQSWGDVYDKNLQFNHDVVDQAWDEHPYAYGTGMAVGIVPQMAIGTGEASLAGTVVRGAATGALTSVADSRENLATVDGWKNAGVDAVKTGVVGAGLGAAAHGAVNLAGRINPRSYGQEVVEAVDNLSRDGIRIPVSPGHAGGGITRTVTQTAEELPIVGLPMRIKHDNVDKGAAKAFERTVQDAADGTPVGTLESAAKNLQDPAQDSLAKVKPAADEFFGHQYDHFDSVAGKVEVTPTKALSFLDARIAAAENSILGPKTPWLAEAKSLRERIAGGKFTVSDYRNLRTELRLSQGKAFGELSPKEAASIKGLEERLRGAITDDIHGSLNAGGKGYASSMLRGIDTDYAKASELNHIIEPLLKLPPEQLAGHLERLAQERGGDSEQLGHLLSVLGKDGRASLQAAFIGSLGRPNASSADVGFSLNSFLTRWGGDEVKGGLSSKAKDLLFTGQVRRDLDDLATLARASRRYGAKRQGSVGGAFVLYMGGWSAAIPAGVLAIPGAARALVSLGKAGRLGIPKFAQGMERLARRNPTAATELLGVRDSAMGIETHNPSVNMQDPGPNNSTPAAPADTGEFSYLLDGASEDSASTPDTANTDQPMYDENGELIQ